MGLKILDLCETRWMGMGQNNLASSETIIYSGPEGQHVQGDGLLMTPDAAKALIEWEPISARILSA